MESLVDRKLFKGVYLGKTVLVTGHTGFKGSWLALWLTKLGANVIGYSLNPPTKSNHFDLLDLNINSIIGDILDISKLEKVINEFKPAIVFHLAAQSLVRESYKNPLLTFQTNIIGTANVFEACKNSNSVKAIINVTSDKCYENKEWTWGYRENDRIGGYDPYSVSKGCSELLTSSYQKTFFNTENYNGNGILLASVRAGNVIGGGDWANDRLIPDIVKATNKGQVVSIRNPKAVRPWQHVLDPLSGYLFLGQKLLEKEKEFSGAWNFGPSENQHLSVKQVLIEMSNLWKKIQFEENIDNLAPHEANLLQLNCSKSNNLLKWRSVWNTYEAIAKTTEWYKEYYTNKRTNSIDDLNEYINCAKTKELLWIS